MRGATVHYVDHPYAGVIIRIDEFELPVPEEDQEAGNGDLVAR